MEDWGNTSITRRAMLGLLVGGGVLLSGCNGSTAPARPHVVRYKLKATVSTPAGEHSGSSVIEIAMSRTSRKFDVHGEAVAVDLPDGQTLFVLLRSANEADWAVWALNAVPTPERHLPIKGREERIAQIDRWVEYLNADRGVHPIWTTKPPHNVPGLSVPYMVRFRDIAAPKSVEEVDPNDLAKSFGSGFALQKLTLQVVDDQFTRGIDKRFPWWTTYRDHHFDGTSTVTEDMTKTNIAAHLSSGSFSTEYRR